MALLTPLLFLPEGSEASSAVASAEKIYFAVTVVIRLAPNAKKSSWENVCIYVAPATKVGKKPARNVKGSIRHLEE